MHIHIDVLSFAATGSSQYIFGFANGGGSSGGLYFGSTAVSMAFSYGQSYWTSIATGLTVGAPLTVDVVSDGIDFSITVNQGTYTKTSTKTLADLGIMGSYTLRLGKLFQAFTSGAINLNKTYVKINGITIFNGKQQASTTTNEVYLNRNVGYTTNGNPTIVDGVVSRCDYHNYLNLNSLFPDINNSDMDVFITLKSAGIGTGKGFRNVFSNLCGTIISLTNSSTPAFIVYTKKSGESTYTARNIYNYSAQVNSNNNFYLHFTKNGNVLSIQGANNDGVFKTASTYALEEGEEIAVSSNYPEVMRGDPWGNIENSALDLNETYIKVNGVTWFNGKQQASTTVNEVYLNRNVGYTAVDGGNIHIENGIVSGFSVDDYLETSQTLSFSTQQKIEIATKITTGDTVSLSGIIGPRYGNSTFGIYLQGNKPSTMFYYNNGQQAKNNYNTSSVSLNTNTTYYLKAIYDIQNVTSTIMVSIDGINYTSNTKTLNDFASWYTWIDNNTYRIGNTQSGAFAGSIDLNETYIKVNGVTWFNGKQTATTPVWTRSV